MTAANVVAFMVADRADLGRACVAARTVLRYHPQWRMHLYIRGALPAPWVDLSLSCFEERVSLYDLAAELIEGDRPSGAILNPEIFTVFARLFQDKQEIAIYLNHYHAWFAPLPAVGLPGKMNVLWKTSNEVKHSQSDLAMMSISRGEDLSTVLLRGGVSLEEQLSVLETSTQQAGGVVGLDLRSLSAAQLRFDGRGELRLGEAGVLSACLGKSIEEVSADSYCDTCWLELEKWYLSELRRYEC